METMIGIVPLDQVTDKALEIFDCNNVVLNRWLTTRARTNELAGVSRTYALITKSNILVGFYCLSNHALLHESVNARVRRNMPNPIPVILLGRLAVDRRFQSKGIGKALLRHAIEKCLQASQIVGCRAVVTEPIDESAKTFYLKQGFMEVKQGSHVLIFQLQLNRV